MFIIFLETEEMSSRIYVTLTPEKKTQTDRQTETQTYPGEDAYIRRSYILHHKW